jgi:hypothetical protein
VSDLDVSEEEVRAERVRLVDRRAHWAYLFMVLGGSMLLMLGLIALLDATS